MKHEWRKHEKAFYLPKTKPEQISIPEFNFFTLEGEGNPNDDFFSEYIGILYSLSYAVKMSNKKGLAPKNYFEYTVYPLEGVWDLKPEAKAVYDGTLDKDALVFKLMIRQPEFVDNDFANTIIELTRKNKPHQLLDKVKFEKLNEGACIQMMHIGPYDNEPASFKKMEEFASKIGTARACMTHREIYLSDARKVAPEKLKTVLRFKTEG